MYWWDTFAIPADAHLLNGYALNGYASHGYVLVGYVLNGYVLVGYVLVGYVLVGYVWNGYVWNMCGVRYANNLLKNPATKRLLVKTGGFFFSGHPSQKAPPKSAMLPSICDADAMGKGKKMGKG